MAANPVPSSSIFTVYAISSPDQNFLSYNYDPETENNSCLAFYLKISTITSTDRSLSPANHDSHQEGEENNPQVSETIVPVLCSQLLSHPIPFTAVLRSEASELGLSQDECNELVEQVIRVVMYWTASSYHYHAPRHPCRIDVPVIHVRFSSTTVLIIDDDVDATDNDNNIRRQQTEESTSGDEYVGFDDLGVVFGQPSDGDLIRGLKKVDVGVGGALSVDGKVVEKDDCSVCLVDLASMIEGGIDVRCLPCHHMFHRVCIERWLRKSNTCPLCRFNPVV